MSGDPNTIYMAGSDQPYCRVEAVPDPVRHVGAGPSFGNGIRITPLQPEGAPIMLTSRGAHQLEQILRRLRTEGGDRA